MLIVNGTKGYSEIVDGFIEATGAVDFSKLHRAYIDLIPSKPGRVLDLGAGSGRDASVLAAMGHHVVAVEPMIEFRSAAECLHPSPYISWLDDSLPNLQKLGNRQFDFVLASGVWHHIDLSERRTALERIVGPMRRGAIFALSLRSGPASGGTHVFPTDSQHTIELAATWGLRTLVHLSDQPSLIKGKENIRWAYLAFRKL